MVAPVLSLKEGADISMMVSVLMDSDKVVIVQMQDVLAGSFFRGGSLGAVSSGCGVDTHTVIWVTTGQSGFSPGRPFLRSDSAGPL